MSADMEIDSRVSPWTWIGLGVAATWVIWLPHETAHYLGMVTLVRPNGGSDAPAWAWVAMSASGPAVTLATIGIACAVVARDRRSGHSVLPRRRRLAIAIGVVAATRAFIIAGGLALSQALGSDAGMGFDEGVIERGTGVPAVLLVAAETLLSGWGMHWLITQLPPAGRAHAVAWLALGLLVGEATVTMIGPAFGFPM